MKKLILFLFFLSVLTSCGGADNGANKTDGLELTSHRIFITSSTIDGAMTGGSGATGLLKADSICKSLAGAAGLTRDYKAILSDTSKHASNRLVISGAIYVIDASGNSNEIADSAAALWNSSTTPLKNTIDYDESATYTANKEVWSGTESGGTLGVNTCSDWTDTTQTGDYGTNGSKDGNWIESGSSSLCSNSRHLYCISQ